MRTAIRKENKLHWFVMTCKRPELIDDCLDKYNADVETSQDEKVPNSFIPSIAIMRKELRGSIRRFIFLQVRPSGLEKLRTQYWNIGDTHLTHYRDGEGQEITIRDDMMQRFINGCMVYGQKFELHTKDTDFVEGMKVTINEGTFKGLEGEVYNVHFKGDGVSFSIAIKFFANDQYIHIHDRTPDFVTLHDRDSIIFDANFIDLIETSLLTILSRRVNKKKADDATLAKEDQQLTHYLYLRHAIIDDPQLNYRLDALMSISATLSKSAQEKSRYNSIIKQNIKTLRQEEPDITTQTALAYQLTALYLSTRDAQYRDELKPLVLHQLPEHPALRKFLSLVRKG